MFTPPPRNPDLEPRIPRRGALSNPTGRFETLSHSSFNDGWDCNDELAPGPKTTLHSEKVRSIITRNQSPDIPFDRSINPYKGCEHGCVYCFARPSHEYLGYSAGLDFETQIITKPNAAEVLTSELSKPSYRPAVIALGANTDPYQPAERSEKITEQILAVLSSTNHPVTIITKSSNVLRDLPVLKSMGERNLVHVYLSITTLDPQLALKMEPRASSPSKRLQALEKLSEAGISTGVLASPMIPALNDFELEGILNASAERGATCAGYILLRLPHGVRELFSQWLQTHYPDRAERVLNLLRTTHDGELYQSQFGVRMSGTGPVAQILSQRFSQALRRLKLRTAPLPLNTSLFTAPKAPESAFRGRNPHQLSLFK